MWTAYKAANIVRKRKMTMNNKLQLVFCFLLTSLLTSCVTLDSLCEPDEVNDKIRYYYEKADTAFQSEKFNKAATYYEKTINIILDSAEKTIVDKTFCLESMREDVDIASKAKSNWKLYYYKGILATGILYDYKNFTYKRNTYTRKDINTAKDYFKKSIDIENNYQSHIALFFIGPDDEINIAQEVAKSLNYMNVVGNIYLGLGKAAEVKEDFEKAYQYFSEADKILNTSESRELLLTLLDERQLSEEAKRLGYKTLKDFKIYIERTSYKNFYRYLNIGNNPYGNSYIPFEKGDIILVPKNLLIIIDFNVTNNEYIYLISGIGMNILSTCSYLVTEKEIESIYIPDAGNVITSPLKISCIGESSFIQNCKTKMCYSFKLIE